MLAHKVGVGIERMRWAKWLILAFLISEFFGVVSPGWASTQLDVLYLQVLRRPTDTQLNLEFARAAEAAGILRWALSAYERVTVNDPGNAEAQWGLQRIRRKLQPNVSQVTVELGSAVETNPRYYLGPQRTELEGLASASLRDERAVNDIRWRTTGAVAGQVYSQSGDLNYGYAGLNTGPVLDLLPGIAVVPAVGGAVTYFDHHFYYGEGAVSTTFEGASQGAYQALQLKAAYRSYDNFFPTSNGFYTEARGRIAFPNILGNASVIIVSPWILYSDIPGTIVLPQLTELQPGAYLESGGKIEIYKGLTDWAIVGANMSFIDRAYRIDTVPSTGSKRNDELWVPGASLLFPHVWSFQTDFRLDYQYISDHSNDPTKSFSDHIITGKFVHRFDPTKDIWTQLASSPTR
jgi:hypothetical protein